METLTLSQVVDHETVDGVCWVYVEVPESIDTDTSKNVIDRYDGVALLRVTLSELDEYPECAHCGRPSLDLDGDICDDCAPETQERVEKERYADMMTAAAEASVDWCWR